MRCTTTLLPSVNYFPAYLRAAGYYCSDASAWVRVAAVNVLDLIDEQARPALGALRKAAHDESRYVRAANTRDRAK